MRRLMDLTFAAVGLGVLLWSVHVALREDPTEVETAESGNAGEERQVTDWKEELTRRNNETRETVRREEEERRRRFEEKQERRLKEEDRRQPLQVPSDPAPYVPRPSTSAASESRPSDVDRKREAARRELATLLGRIAPAADRLFQDVEGHRRICGNDNQGQCRLSLENIVRQAIVISANLADAQELARTSWLPPGEVRELRKQNGLSDGIWDRLISIVNRYAR